MAKRLMRISKKEKESMDEDTPILIEDTGVDELEEKTPEDVEALKSEFGGSDYKVSAYRLCDDGSSYERIGSFTVDEFNGDLLAGKYGGGKFKFKIIKPDGKVAKVASIRYARPVPVRVDEKAVQDNSKAEMLAMMRENAQKSESMVIAMVQAFKEIAVRPAPVSQGSTLAEMIQALALLKNMNPDKNPTAEVQNYLELFKSGINLGKEVTGLGAGDGEGGIENIAIKELMKIVIPALSKTLTKQPASAGQPQTIKQPIINPAEIKAGGSQERGGENAMQDRPVYLDETEKTVMLMIEQNKFILVNSAKLDADIEPIAEIIVNQIESFEDLLKLRNYLINSSGRIFIFYPDMLQYQTWVLALTDKIKFYINDVEKQTNDDNMKNNSVNGTVDENKGGENI